MSPIYIKGVTHKSQTLAIHYALFTSEETLYTKEGCVYCCEVAVSWTHCYFVQVQREFKRKSKETKNIQLHSLIRFQSLIKVLHWGSLRCNSYHIESFPIVVIFFVFTTVDRNNMIITAHRKPVMSEVSQRTALIEPTIMFRWRGRN